MNKIIIFTLILICVAVNCFANPFVAASPLENNVKYYVIKIDGQDEYIPANWDMNFLYDMGYLKYDKKYSCELKAGNDEGESPPLKFFIVRKSNKNWVFFSIQKIPEEVINDPYYNDRFIEEELYIKINRDYVMPSGDPLSSDPLNPITPSSGGGGGGCFINTVR
jgi:hypothetical protein